MNQLINSKNRSNGERRRYCGYNLYINLKDDHICMQSNCFIIEKIKSRVNNVINEISNKW